ncbi:MAG: hypothetical protein ABEJ65_08475, partial [bacterium]
MFSNPGGIVVTPLLWGQLFALLILILLSGFFSGTETALTSLGKLRSKR